MGTTTEQQSQGKGHWVGVGVAGAALGGFNIVATIGVRLGQTLDTPRGPGRLIGGGHNYAVLEADDGLFVMDWRDVTPVGHAVLGGRVSPRPGALEEIDRVCEAMSVLQRCEGDVSLSDAMDSLVTPLEGLSGELQVMLGGAATDAVDAARRSHLSEVKKENGIRITIAGRDVWVFATLAYNATGDWRAEHPELLDITITPEQARQLGVRIVKMKASFVEGLRAAGYGDLPGLDDAE